MDLYKTYKNVAGIYKLTCVVNGKIYIGKSINIGYRLNRHKNSSKRTDNINGPYLKNAILKYGWDSFNVEILEDFKNFDKFKDNDTLLEREAFYINKNNSFDKNMGYNLCKFSNDRTGQIASEETRKKLSAIKLGKPLSAQHRANLKGCQLGKIVSEKTKKKISLSNLGKKHSDEHREKTRLRAIGRPVSEETKEKIRLGNMGKTRTEETKEKMRKPKSEKAKENMRKPKSEETKEKMRQSKLKKSINQYE